MENFIQNTNGEVVPEIIPEQGAKNAPLSKKAEIPQIQQLDENFLAAFKLVDDIVLKNYITKLPELNVIPLGEGELANNLSKIRLFKIIKMVYEQDEAATYKFASVFNAVAATKSSLVTIIDSDGIKTDFYFGIRSLSDDNSPTTSYKTLVNAMNGQFPGTEIENLKTSKIEALLDSVETASISAVSGIANNKNKEFVNNREYIQGLEKLALAMQGSKYTAIILANPTSQEQLNNIRQSYENIYTQLSPFTNTIVNYGTNDSNAKTITTTTGDHQDTAKGKNTTDTSSTTETKNVGKVQTSTEPTLRSKIGSGISASLGIAGAIIGTIVMPGPGTAAGAGLGTMLGGSIGGMVGSAVSMAMNKTQSVTTGGGSTGVSHTHAVGTNETVTYGTSHSLATSLGLTTGESQSMQLTIQNKPLIDILQRIDKQLERLAEFESVGMWECAAYFLSSDSSVTEVAAATYKALMSGENSGLEVSAINTWNLSDKIPKNELIAKYICNFIHPVFIYQLNKYDIPVMPTSMVSGNELAIHMGLPRHSVSGFPVVEHADFGKEVVKYDKSLENDSIKLGNIFNMGHVIKDSYVCLNLESLAMHTLIVGATGSGKSNTVYSILDALTTTRHDITFMIIEPAKGEYKRIFGYKRGSHVLGTNPNYTQLLKINPFKFPKNIHVLEHVDRLIEIFNVCWPMYAAMPAVLKEAVLASYEACGWDLTESINIISENIYPSFTDLLKQLIRVINESSYSDEVKSNYIGSLSTRVKSLTNGLNGQIFTADEIENSILFDSNVIVDLSRVGSQETKALLMGILVMRLSEYRLSRSTFSNQKLHHITVLEEAHNILKNNKNIPNSEGADVSGKSVEMLSNAIAEMRTYGEGFIIADQSPSNLDMSAIKNTNTKIIMRLPEEEDRRVSGKSAALKDKQLDEIAILPKGVAVIYQNDWIEPVLCKINKFNGVEKEYLVENALEENKILRNSTSVLINFVAKNRLSKPDPIDKIEVLNAIEHCNCSTETKIKLKTSMQEYQKTNNLTLWENNNFIFQAQLVKEILNLHDEINCYRKLAVDWNAFNCYMNSLVAQKLAKTTDDILLSINHCLMKVYSQISQDEKTYYDKWYKEFSERGSSL
jgi:hypothetical protein